MTIIFFDDQARETLLPLTFTRPPADLRVGILKVSEKWLHHFKGESSYLTAPYLQIKFPFKPTEDNLFINGSVCPDEALLMAVNGLKKGEALIKDQICLAARSENHEFGIEKLEEFKKIAYGSPILKITYPEDIFKYNEQEIRADFILLTKGRTSQNLSGTNTVIGDDIFVEEGVEAECSTFNTSNGPIYLGTDAQVWEGSHIRGAFALCKDAQVKMGSKIYGATTIGPHSRVGGELNNAVIWGNSSKGHDGYLGNAVIGEWCNIGADSNNSNLKNNYAEVKLWDYTDQKFRGTGLQFCGMIMADHSKCGINTMFNTGTVVGVGANIFGAGFPRNFVPDFAWGGAHGYEKHALNKMFETAEKVFERKGKVFDEDEKNILTHIFGETEKHRIF